MYFTLLIYDWTFPCPLATSLLFEICIHYMYLVAFHNWTNHSLYSFLSPHLFVPIISKSFSAYFGIEVIYYKSGMRLSHYYCSIYFFAEFFNFFNWVANCWSMYLNKLYSVSLWHTKCYACHSIWYSTESHNVISKRFIYYKSYIYYSCAQYFILTL